MIAPKDLLNSAFQETLFLCVLVQRQVAVFIDLQPLGLLQDELSDEKLVPASNGCVGVVLVVEGIGGIFVFELEENFLAAWMPR